MHSPPDLLYLTNTALGKAVVIPKIDSIFNGINIIILDAFSVHKSNSLLL